MIAVSLVHGGPSPGFFSKILFNCLVYGPENVKPNLDDVADIDVAQTIKKVNKAKLTGKFFFFKSVFRYKGLLNVTLVQIKMLSLSTPPPMKICTYVCSKQIPNFNLCYR